MDDPATMRVVEALTDRDQPVKRVRNVEPGLFSKDSLIGLPFDELHTNERVVPIEAQIVNGDDIRMVERRGGARFLQQLFARRRIFGERLLEHFVRDGPLEQPVERFVHRPHPAFAEHTGDLVARFFLMRHDWLRALDSLGACLLFFDLLLKLLIAFVGATIVVAHDDHAAQNVGRLVEVPFRFFGARELVPKLERVPGHLLPREHGAKLLACERGPAPSHESTRELHHGDRIIRVRRRYLLEELHHLGLGVRFRGGFGGVEKPVGLGEEKAR